MIKKTGFYEFAAPICTSFLLLLIAPALSQKESVTTIPEYPSETPEQLVGVTSSFDYIRREAMIPLRDGVRLHTVILLPRNAKNAPKLFTRTPYDATALTSHAESSHLGSVLYGYDNVTDLIIEGGYIRVVQDVRDKHGSEGDYIMNRPLIGQPIAHLIASTNGTDSDGVVKLIDVYPNQVAGQPAAQPLR